MPTSTTTGYFQAGRQLLSVQGKDSLDYLQRVLTCNLKALKPNQVIPGALLTGQGKLVAFFSLYQEADGYSLETFDDCAEALSMRLERYVFSEDVTISLRDDIVLDIVAPTEFSPLPDLNCYRDFEWAGLPVRLARVGEGEYRLIAPSLPTGLPQLSAEQYETWRIEHGIPAWGKELNEDLIPLNLGIDQAFDHHKGCYTGQEVISRATHVSHAPLELLGVQAKSGLEPGTELTTEGDYIGVVTSSSYSADRQATIGLARMRWQKARPGTQVQAGGEVVEVVALPFA